MLYFITSNQGKYKEVVDILSPLAIEQLDIELAEIQSLSPQEVIAHKLAEARKRHDGDFIVEDVSLELEALHGLPGPFVKWFLQTLGKNGLTELIQGKSAKAIHRVTYGCVIAGEEFFLEGVTEGVIVPSRGENGFGYDPVFQPNGSDNTYSEMDDAEAMKWKPRYKALQALKKRLTPQN